MLLVAGLRAEFASGMMGKERQGDEGGVSVIQGVLELGLCLGLLAPQGGLMWVAGFGARSVQGNLSGESCLTVLLGKLACSALTAV